MPTTTYPQITLSLNSVHFMFRNVWYILIFFICKRTPFKLRWPLWPLKLRLFKKIWIRSSQKIWQITTEQTGLPTVKNGPLWAQSGLLLEIRWARFLENFTKQRICPLFRWTGMQLRRSLLPKSTSETKNSTVILKLWSRQLFENLNFNKI